MGRYVGRSVFFGQVMSFHHSDQMSQRSQVSRKSEVNKIVFCMLISKVLSESVTD